MSLPKDFNELLDDPSFRPPGDDPEDYVEMVSDTFRYRGAVEVIRAAHEARAERRPYSLGERLRRAWVAFKGGNPEEVTDPGPVRAFESYVDDHGHLVMERSLLLEDELVKRLEAAGDEDAHGFQ
jgi:hypothetical protein